MVGVLIRMKFAVLRGAFGGWTAAAVTFGGLIGLGAAVLTLRLGAIDFADPGVAVDVLALVCLLWTLAWAIGPALSGGGDETLRPEHFALLPVTPRRLALGLLGAAFVGLAPAFSLVAFGALVVHGAGLGAVPLVVAVVATVLQLILAVLVARVVAGGLGAALASRRGREFGLVGLVALSLTAFGARWIWESFVPMLTGGTSAVLRATLRGLPTGWGAVAVSAADRFAWGPMVAAVLGLAVVDVALLLAWGALLDRRMTTPTSGADAGTGGDRPIRRILPATPLGAAVGKELRFWSRDTHRLVFLIAPLAESGWLFVVPPLRAYVGVSYFAWLFLRLLNAYGIEVRKAGGPDLWTVLMTPGAARVDVRARQIAFLIVGGVPAIACTVVALVLGGGTAGYPWAFSALLAVAGGAAGLFPMWAVRFPFRLGSPGAVGRLVGASLLFAPVLALVLVPAWTVIALGGGWAGVPVGLATGGLLAWWLGRLAYRRLDAHGPEILAALCGGAAAPAPVGVS